MRLQSSVAKTDRVCTIIRADRRGLGICRPASHGKSPYGSRAPEGPGRGNRANAVHFGYERYGNGQRACILWPRWLLTRDIGWGGYAKRADKPGSVEDGHLSWRACCHAAPRTLPERGPGRPMALLFALAPDGVYQAAASPRRWWSLTPPFQLFPLRRGAGGSLLFCGTDPSGCPAWSLTSILPCGARTFLTRALWGNPPPRARTSGPLRVVDCSTCGATWAKPAHFPSSMRKAIIRRM